MSTSEFEKMYSPSVWSKRDDVVNLHIEFGTKESKKSREDIPCELNVSYGAREREKLDIYGTDLPNDSPIFIFIHGGYWQQLSKDISSYAAQSFYKHSFKTIVIGYTLCPEVTVPDIVKEIEEATKKCIKYAKNCGSRGLYICGYSVGAHLIACMFSNLFPTLSQEDHGLFKGVVLCSGVYDLLPLIYTTINDVLNLTSDNVNALSPMFQEIPMLNFPVYVVVAEYESPAFKEQSNKYYEKIKLKCNSEFKIIKDRDHFDIVENMKYTDYELVKYVVSLDKKE